MKCPSCSSEIVQPANFCPVCGATLSPAAHVPETNEPQQPSNVVPLRAVNPLAETPASVHVDLQTGAYAPGQAPVGQPAASPPGTDRPSHDVQGRPLDEAIGDFFSDAPSMDWTGDFGPEDTGEPRVVGSMVAGTSILMLVLALVVYGAELWRGNSGAEAGGFVLLSAILWIWYLSLPSAQQHDAMLGWYDAVARLLDRKVDPLRSRTEAQLVLRRERDRYRAMRDERERRVSDLGEAAYRRFRSAELDESLVGPARRVMAIEQQMLLQDARLHDMRTTDGPPPDDRQQVEHEPSAPSKPRRRRRRPR